jgi:phage terminase large subunit-like protein
MDVVDKIKFPYCNSGHQYALDILEGKIVSCLYIKKACERYFSDLEKAKDPNNSYYFSWERAERYLKLVQKFKHVKGNWKNPCIVYEPWQNFTYMNIFGFILHSTNSRRFRTAYVEVARGNGKSAIASQTGLYMLSLENPKGNEVYSAATGRDQARIILDSSRAMARANPGFCEKTGTKVLAHKIVHDATESVFRALSSDSSTLDGLQPVCALIDELHSHKNRGVYDVIDSAMSKRNDSLMFMITTAGFDTTGIGYSQSQYAKRVAVGNIEDDSFFAIVFTIDKVNEEFGITEDDDPFDPEVWIKANPNYGVSVDPINFTSKAKKAKENPADRNNFLVKHLNIWTDSKDPYFNTVKWDACKIPNLSIQHYFDEKCFVGIDLASKIDLTSIAYIFKDGDKYSIFTDNYCPMETIKTSNNENYIKWMEHGWLTSTPGEAINYPKLHEEFLERSKDFRINAVHYDPWNATEFAQRLDVKRIETAEFRMNTGNFSEPMKRLDALIREGKIEHNGNELVRWCLGNVVAKMDANDNVYPRKESEELKIDPIISIIMALAGWINEEQGESVYESRGIRIL